MEKNLFLTIKKEFFDKILSGKKTEEYRVVNSFYKSRIENKKYTHIILQKGYNAKSKRLKAEYLGYEIKEIETEIYGKTEVYVLKLKNAITINE